MALPLIPLALGALAGSAAVLMFKERQGLKDVASKSKDKVLDGLCDSVDTVKATVSVGTDNFKNTINDIKEKKEAYKAEREQEVCEEACEEDADIKTCSAEESVQEEVSNDATKQ